MVPPSVLHRSLALALCASLAAVPLPASAQQPDPASMSDEQKLERAKQLYAEAEAALNDDKAAEALAKFEQAYNDFAPELHLFNVNIGIAAQTVGDCIKAKKAFERFLDLVDKHQARKEAQARLLQIERSKCVEKQEERERQAAEEAAAALQVAASEEGDNYDAPVLEANPLNDEEEEDEPTRNVRAKFLAGVVLTSVGGAALIGAGVSLGIANSRARELADLSSPGNTTGFSEAVYSDEEVAQLHQRGLPAANGASVGLFVGGGVLAAVGVTLIVLDRVGKKAEGDVEGEEPSARRRGPRLTGLGPAIVRGGGGAAATLRF
ncbi:MAG: hypothetical protein AAGF11_17600 [Myxococcota bacterium]